MKLHTLGLAALLLASAPLTACTSTGGTISAPTLSSTTVSQAIAGAETAVTGAEKGITAAALNGWIKKDSTTAKDIVTYMGLANTALDAAHAAYASGDLLSANAQAQSALDNANQAKAETPTAAPAN